MKGPFLCSCRHPDKNSNSEECTEMFQRIQSAYAKLTREFSGEYSDESEDDDYYDEYDEDDDGEDCDYNCDCFFHGGIPPWEFFEQLSAPPPPPPSLLRLAPYFGWNEASPFVPTSGLLPPSCLPQLGHVFHTF